MGRAGAFACQEVLAPRRPCGRRRNRPFQYSIISAFQSTPPMRAATACLGPLGDEGGVSIQAAHAGGDERGGDGADVAGVVSIHAAHAGGDEVNRPVTITLESVSIHAAHAGGDRNARRVTQTSLCFNPRRPCGRRQVCAFFCVALILFQSTPPMRAATGYGGTCGPCWRFNPRRPCGRRRRTGNKGGSVSMFQSTPPMRAATVPIADCSKAMLFQSTPPMRAATPRMRKSSGG